MTRVLLAAPPFAGHLNPLLVIGDGLRRHGFDVHVATGATKAGLVESLGFPVTALLADDPGVFDRIADTSRPVRSHPILLARQLRANLNLLPQASAELNELTRRWRPDAVLADFTAPVAGLVAQSHGVPWLTTTPTPFALETKTGTPSYCGGWGPARHAGHRLRDAAGRGATTAVKRGMRLAFARQFRAAGTGIYRPDGSEAAYSPTAILGLGMRELELARDWPTQFRMVGPVTTTVEPWPSPPRLPVGPLVLVTWGTHLRWATSDLLTTARNLAGAAGRHQIVVSLGDASRAAPEPLTSDGRVHVFAHLPYDDVLPRCAAVVHHGGAGITYAAIQAGVPAVVCPQDYDQFDYAARIVAAGAGVRVRHHRQAPQALAAALAMPRARLDALTAAARRYDPVAAITRAVEEAVA